ncbi:MAG TPA: glycosyltransferase [Candidatus Baltobacteraceae bacterium]|jgi:glycosyltransferase involved in cell wall biosynthesis|nr:glycosyltransferase [Candidatus Baltobacteraceae bacterium]
MQLLTSNARIDGLPLFRATHHEGRLKRKIFVNFHLQEVWGGQPKYVDMLSRALIDAGIPAFCVVGRPMPEWGDTPYPVIPVNAVPNRREYPYDILPKEILWEHADFCANGALSRIIDSIAALGKGIDTVVLHGHHLDGALVAAHVERLMRLRVPMKIEILATVHSLGLEKVHGIEPLMNGARETNELRRRLDLEALAYGRAAHSGGVIVGTPYAQSLVARQLAIPLEKVRICRPGIDHSLFNACKPERERQRFLARLGISADAQIVLSSGRMDPVKNHETVVDAFAEISDAFPRAHLVVMGGFAGREDEAYRQSLRQRAARLGIAAQTTVCQGVSHDALPEVYRSSDVFVVAEWYGPWNMMVAEALACSTPVVGSRNSGAIKDAERRGAVIAVRPDDVSEIASNVQRLLSSADLRESLKCRALDYAKHLSWKAAAHITAGLD